MSMVRWGGVAAMASGAAFVVDALLVVAGPDATWTNVVYVLAALPLLGGIYGLRAAQRGGAGRLGAVGFRIVVVAVAGQILGLLVFLAGSEILVWLVFPVGFLLVPLGLVIYGIATWRARVMPRWCGVALIAVPILAVVLGDYGGILFGLMWLALGYMLFSRREAPARPASVR
ncbi:MAG: hypothetical protein ACRDSJ_21985 [Rubrobacteraceae bacterium]